MDTRLAALQKFCIDNPELERLESMVDQFNLFEAAGLTRQEIRHSKFLSFLLNPLAPHGIGSFFLEKFLQSVLADPDQELPISQLDLHIWDMDDTLVETERFNIDILITNRQHRLSIIIETKIGSSEHSNQLKRYKQIILEKFPHHKIIPIFLTSDGSPASDPQYISASFDQVSDVISQTLSRLNRQLSEDILLALNHYQELIKRHIVNNSEIEELCVSIYQKHKQAIDLIMENIGDDRKIISDRLCATINQHPELEPDYFSKSIVKTCPKSWLHLIPNNAEFNNDYPRVFVLMIRVQANQVDICANIQPGDQITRERIFGVAKKNPGPYSTGNRKLAKIWCMVSKDVLLTKDEFQTLDAYALADLAEERLNDFVASKLPRLTEPLQREFQTVPPPQ